TKKPFIILKIEVGLSPAVSSLGDLGDQHFLDRRRDFRCARRRSARSPQAAFVAGVLCGPLKDTGIRYWQEVIGNGHQEILDLSERVFPFRTSQFEKYKRFPVRFETPHGEVARTHEETQMGVMLKPCHLRVKERGRRAHEGTNVKTWTPDGD